MKKRVLGLQLPTDPRWVNLAQMQLADILTDHAWCEQKAATTCISLIVQYADFPELIDRLTPVVTEEWGHFKMVLNELKKRNLKLGPPRKDEYVNALLSLIRKGTGRKELLLDRLLFAGLIEARSCERFRLLSEGISEESLRDFYYHLMVAEAGHYRLFLDLAGQAAGEKKAEERWKELLAAEAEIIKSLEIRGDRMH